MSGRWWYLLAVLVAIGTLFRMMVLLDTETWRDLVPAVLGVVVVAALVASGVRATGGRS